MGSLSIFHHSSLLNRTFTSPTHRRHSRALIAAPSALLLVVVTTLFVSAPRAYAQSPIIRTPLGVYAHINIEDALNRYKGQTPATSADLHNYLKMIYQNLLADPAISGLTVGQHWDHIQLDDPACVFSRSCADGPDGYDWSYLDDAFAAANAAHKSIQLLINSGVESPTWLMDKLPSCDGLFTGNGTAPFDCGKVTFNNFPEQAHADSTDPPLPLPWSPVYIGYWDDFLLHLSARYSSNPAFTYIAIAGPVCASTEMILPTTADGSTQISGMPSDQAWQKLIHHSFPFLPGFENSDQVFIDAWKQSIDAYEVIFHGVTLVISADDGDALPELSDSVTVNPDNFLYDVDCSKSDYPVSCEAKTEILSYFARARGDNEKSTQVGGMTAGSNVKTGNIGIPGVKVLTSYTPPLRPPFLGGAEFDFQVSFADQLQQQGCPDYSKSDPNPTDCVNLTPEQGAYNTFTVFFDATPDASDFGGSSSIPPIQNAPIQYVEVDYVDVQYAQDPSHICQILLPGMTPAPPSLQDIYNQASYDLFTMAGKPATLPPSTCPP
jgi:hypothetical protein